MQNNFAYLSFTDIENWFASRRGISEIRLKNQIFCSRHDLITWNIRDYFRVYFAFAVHYRELVSTSVFYVQLHYIVCELSITTGNIDGSNRGKIENIKRKKGQAEFTNRIELWRWSENVSILSWEFLPVHPRIQKWDFRSQILRRGGEGPTPLGYMVPN